MSAERPDGETERNVDAKHIRAIPGWTIPLMIIAGIGVLSAFLYYVRVRYRTIRSGSADAAQKLAPEPPPRDVFQNDAGTFWRETEREVRYGGYRDCWESAEPRSIDNVISKNIPSRLTNCKEYSEWHARMA